MPTSVLTGCGATGFLNEPLLAFTWAFRHSSAPPAAMSLGGGGEAPMGQGSNQAD